MVIDPFCPCAVYRLQMLPVGLDYLLVNQKPYGYQVFQDLMRQHQRYFFGSRRTIPLSSVDLAFNFHRLLQGQLLRRITQGFDTFTVIPALNVLVPLKYTARHIFFFIPVQWKLNVSIEVARLISSFVGPHLEGVCMHAHTGRFLRAIGFYKQSWKIIDPQPSKRLNCEYNFL